MFSSFIAYETWHTQVILTTPKVNESECGRQLKHNINLNYHNV